MLDLKENTKSVTLSSIFINIVLILHNLGTALTNNDLLVLVNKELDENITLKMLEVLIIIGKTNRILSSTESSKVLHGPLHKSFLISKKVI